MRSVGLRVKPKEIYYSILEESGDIYKVINLSKLIIPKALALPDSLKYIRNTFIDILLEYNVKRAGIRVTETFAPNKDILRISIEAIIQELLASSPVEKFIIGQISNLSATLKIQRSEFKPLANGNINIFTMSKWGDKKIEERECILAAISALKI